MVDNSQRTITVTSPAFQDGGLIPIRYTAEAENVSPCIEWKGIPSGTVSIVIITEDRDIPMPQIPLFTWVHWIVYNIPPDTLSIPEAVPVSETLEGGRQQGFTSYRKHDTQGHFPCQEFINIISPYTRLTSKSILNHGKLLKRGY